MATNTKENGKENAATPANPAIPASADKPKAKAVDYLEKIGRNFNPVNARELFGAKWVEAMNAVAKAGGYGTFTEAQFNLYDKKLFGGFAIPYSPDASTDARFAETRTRINDALNGVK